MNKKNIATTNGKRGGNLVGKPHKDKQGNDVGGIRAVVTDANGRPVELEGGEVIINKEASKKHWKELSRINQSAGGGVPINKPIDPHDEDPEEYAKGGKIEFNPNQLPNKWILNYAKNIKKNHPEIWKLGGNIYGNQAFENLLRVSERGYWLDSEEWFYVKWRSFVARHKGDFRIAGVVAMLKWVDKVDRGWKYMKDLIEEEIKKRSDKKSGWKTKKTERMSGGGELEKGIKTEMEHKDTIEKFKRKGVSDRQVATSIAKDHLKEDPKYYSKLSDMESMGKGGQTERQQAKIGYTMREFKEGKLKTSYGEKVTDEKQALAIALSKAGVEKKEYGGAIEVGLKGFYNGKKRVPIEISKITGANVYFINQETGEQKRSQKENFERLFESGSDVTDSSPTHAMPIIDDTPSPKKDDTKISTDDLDTKIEKLQKKIKTFQGIIDNPKSEKQRSFAKGKMKEAREELEKLLSQKHGNVKNYVHSQLNKDDKQNTQPKQPTSKTQVDYYELFKSKNELIEMSNNETMAVQLGRFVKMADEDRLMRMEDIQDFKKAIDKLG